MGADLATDVTVAEDRQTPLRTWAICGLMLLATMLNYMDRQTLAQQATDIRGELRLSNESYGWLETGFGLAFAVGSLVMGTIADRVSLRWLNPAILLGWSAVGFMTGWVNNYTELFLCRVMLGFFEARQWPCALAASATAAASRPASAGQQHPPERRRAGRDRHAANHPALEQRRAGRLAAAVSGRGRSGPGLDLCLAHGDSTPRPGHHREASERRTVKPYTAIGCDDIIAIAGNIFCRFFAGISV